MKLDKDFTEHELDVLSDALYYFFDMGKWYEKLNLKNLCQEFPLYFYFLEKYRELHDINANAFDDAHSYFLDDPEVK